MQLQNEVPGRSFQVKKKIRQNLEARKRKVLARLEAALDRPTDAEDLGPVMSARRIQYELATKTQAIAHGGIGAIHMLAREVGLPQRIDAELQLLKQHRPYHESDHVLNIAYNPLCGGRVLDDIELRRNDEGFLNALGAEAIPDPTTAGDFCRRFDKDAIEQLMAIVNRVRLDVWKRQRPGFTRETARIDADGTIVPTSGECKEGMALSYKGEWGFHPLIVSLANTGEPLFIENRSGNRGSSEGAAARFDQAAALCRQAGFDDILLRGDTDFSQTQHLDRWDADGIRFVFGYDARKNMVDEAERICDDDYEQLCRKADVIFARQPRAKQPRVKEAVVVANGYRNVKLRSEDVADFDYRPVACEKTYRVVVVRKNLTVERGEVALFDDVRYFFYITNDHQMADDQVVREANERCNQENLIAQLKNGARALHAPLNEFNANWAYMVISSLAWSLKAWFALTLPVCDRWREKHESERMDVLRMEFRTFCNAFVNIPAQILTTGRQLVYRLLSWNRWQTTLFRLLDAV